MLPSKLLISLKSAEELRLVADYAFSWIDLKNPLAGSLGCPEAKTAAEFLESARLLLDRSHCQISIALGEIVDEAWRRLGSTASEFDFVKVAMAGCSDRSDWKQKAERLADVVGGGERLILVHYADFCLAQSPHWHTTLEMAASIGSKYVLIDTYNKSAGRLWDWYSSEAIQALAIDAGQRGIALSIAGSLRISELSMARHLGASIVGIRGAACQDSSRVDSLCHDRLRTVFEIFNNQPVTN